MSRLDLEDIKHCLTQLGPQELFLRASINHSCAYLTGRSETVIAIDQSHKRRVANGLESLDKLVQSSFDKNLARQIASEHLVIAAIPFDPQLAFEITIPRLGVIFHRDGSVEITHATRSTSESLRILVEILDADPTRVTEAFDDNFEVIESESTSSFTSRIEKAINEIIDNQYQKVVLSKDLIIKTPRGADAQTIFQRIAGARPVTYLFSIENFIGASPELVLDRRGDSIVSHPLAGTAPADNVEELLHSAKDNLEHQIVVSQIQKRLSELNIKAEKQFEPTITEYGEIVHLGTEITGYLSDPYAPSSLEIIAHITPTAAINGEPFQSALGYIRDNEYRPRGFYGGVIGYQKAGGDGCWVLNIRSIELNDDEMILRAGVGIVGQSDPLKEDQEAVAKLQAVLTSLRSTSSKSI